MPKADDTNPPLYNGEFMRFKCRRLYKGAVEDRSIRDRSYLTNCYQVLYVHPDDKFAAAANAPKIRLNTCMSPVRPT